MDDYLPDWLKNLVPNAVGDASRAVEPQVSQYRGPNGRLDHNAITSVVPEDNRQEAEMMLKMGDLRRDALNSYAPKPLSWNQQLGGILQEVSVPVAYAQGNSGYAQQMMPNTILKNHLSRLNAYDDKRNEANLNITDQTMSGISDVAIKTLSDARKRREAAKSAVAKSIFAASANGKEAEAQATQMGASYLRSLGLKDDADALERRAQYIAPASPSSPSPSSGGGPLSPSGAAPSGVPGISVTPSSPSSGAPGGPVSAPAPQGAAPVPAQGANGAPSYGFVLSPKRKLAETIMPIDEDAGKAMLEEAKAEETPSLEGAKKTAEEKAKADQARINKAQDAAAIAPKIGSLLDMLDSYSDVPGMEHYTGALEGSSTYAPFTTDVFNALRPGNKATPAIRDQIKGTQMALVSLLKNNIRAPGEGAQDQREFQAVIDTIGDMANANTIEDYHTKLRDAKKRIEIFTGTKIPTQSARLSAQTDEDMQGSSAQGGKPPQRVSTIGERRTKIINGAAVEFEKTPSGWFPVQKESAPIEQDPNLPPAGWGG